MRGKMAQEFWSEKKENELAENEYLLRNDVYGSYIRYNNLPGEILFLRLDYLGGNVSFTINETGYKVSVEDRSLGNFVLVNRNTDNSGFSQQIKKILGEFGNSVELKYVMKDFIKDTFLLSINGKEIEADNNKIKSLIGKLLHTVLSYIKNNFSSYHFTLDFDKVLIDYTYMSRNPKLRFYKADSPEYIYYVFYGLVNSVNISKRKNDGEPEEVFRIEMDLSKYSRRILSDVIKLVLQSAIKKDIYTIFIEGENVKVNGKRFKAEDKVVKDLIDSMENQVGYAINTVRDKLDKLERYLLSP
jgi:hypothetical protein